MKDEKGRIPSYQWYPADWRSDPGVQALSFHERGVWREMIDFMHESPERGRLILNGKAMTVDALSRALGLMKQDLELVLAKLLDYGVASKDKKGVLYCRRMVRDESARLAHKAAGAKGGNPNFKTGQKNPYYLPTPPLLEKDNSKITPPITSHKRKITKRISKKITKILDGKDNLIDNLIDNQKITPSSAFASSSSRPSPNTLVASCEATPDKIPYEEIRTAYNERRGALPKAGPFSDPAKKKIRTRWAAHPDVGFWKTLFDRAGKSERMVAWGDFHWFMKSELNIEKTLNGNYDNDRERKTVPRPPAAPMPRERIPTPEEEDMIAKDASKIFGEFRRKKVGTFSGPADPSTVTASAEEVPV